MATDAVDPAPAIPVRDAFDVLMHAGEVLTGSLAFEETLRNGIELMVPAIADWAAVLVVRDDGTEREITSRHPDPDVEAALLEVRRRRRRATGRSESLRVLESGEPLVAGDVSGAVAPDLTAGERQTIDRLAARSYMVVPLRARGRVFGSLTLLSTTAGRHYTQADSQFAQALAGRFALAVDNALLYEAASRSLGLLDTLFDTAPVGFAFVDLEGRIVRINEALTELGDVLDVERIGRTFEQTWGAAGEPLARALRTVVETGRPVLDREMAVMGLHCVCSCTPVRGLDKELLGVGVVVIDITERRRLLEGERRARARADVLARAGAVLDASLDYHETLGNLADVAVPAIADWCTIRTLDSDGELVHVTTAAVDRDKRDLAADYERRFPPRPTATDGTFAVLRTGASQWVPEITEAMLAGAVGDPEQLDAVRSLGLGSIVIAPLTARGRSVGVITLATAESGRRFSVEDVQLAEELGRRAGVAIDNARLYSERARIAHTLQARLLPRRLPAIPRARVAARYRASGELNEVGGDFYDVFERGDHGWALVVGDVSGKGAEAAAVTALARYTLRTAAVDAGSPSRALLRLNAALLGEPDTSEFVTVVLVYGAQRPGGGFSLQVALAGHPPPLILRSDGTVQPAGEEGTLLGVEERPALHDVEALLSPGDTLLLYTDGVTEAGPRSAMLGEAGLARLLRTSRGLSPVELVTRIEAVAVGAQTRDDIAILALAVDDPA